MPVGRPMTRKLHVKRGDKWLPVFCYRDDGRILTCEREPDIALPQRSCWAKDDLEFFTKKFGNDEFKLLPIRRAH